MSALLILRAIMTGQSLSQGATPRKRPNDTSTEARRTAFIGIDSITFPGASRTGDIRARFGKRHLDISGANTRLSTIKMPAEAHFARMILRGHRVRTDWRLCTE